MNQHIQNQLLLYGNFHRNVFANQNRFPSGTEASPTYYLTQDNTHPAAPSRLVDWRGYIYGKNHAAYDYSYTTYTPDLYTWRCLKRHYGAQCPAVVRRLWMDRIWDTLYRHNHLPEPDSADLALAVSSIWPAPQDGQTQPDPPAIHQNSTCEPCYNATPIKRSVAKVYCLICEAHLCRDHSRNDSQGHALDTHSKQIFAHCSQCFGANRIERADRRCECHGWLCATCDVASADYHINQVLWSDLRFCSRCAGSYVMTPATRDCGECDHENYELCDACYGPHKQFHRDNPSIYFPGDDDDDDDDDDEQDDDQDEEDDEADFLRLFNAGVDDADDHEDGTLLDGMEITLPPCLLPGNDDDADDDEDEEDDEADFQRLFNAGIGDAEDHEDGTLLDGMEITLPPCLRPSNDEGNNGGNNDE